MTQHSREELLKLIAKRRIRSRLSRDLRITDKTIDHWNKYELTVVWTKSHNEGLLIMQLEDAHVASFIATAPLKDTATGRLKPAICDLCYTYRKGGEICRITFDLKRENKKLGFLYCADLECSRNVRNLTSAATYSRTQLHEALNVSQRIERLRSKLEILTERLEDEQ
jgi:hypothetical protein